MGATVRIGRRRATFAIAAGLTAALGGWSSSRAAETPRGKQTYFLLAFSDPLPGQEAAYAKWFEAQDRPVMLSIPGFVSAQHFTDAKVELRHTARKTPQDLLLYTFVADHPEAMQAEIMRDIQSGRAWPGPGIATVSPVTYRAMQPPMKGVGGEPSGAAPGQPATYMVVAFGDALAGHEDSYNAWVDKIHDPELMSKPGMVSGQRGELSAVQMAPATINQRYLLTLTIVTSDLPAVFKGILTGAGKPSPDMDRSRGFGYSYRAVGPAVQAK